MIPPTCFATPSTTRCARAVETFGGLDVLVNNAGIVRDRMMANTSEEEFDAVIAVHLKGHFAAMRHAASYWRGLSKDGKTVDARIINTSSGAGLQGSVGQGNYSAAKAGIAAMTLVAYPGGYSLFIGNTEGEVYASEDGGDTWAEIAGTLAPVSKGDHHLLLPRVPAAAAHP